MCHSDKHPPTGRVVGALSLLFEVSRILGRSLHLRAVVSPVLSAMACHMGMVRGALALVEGPTGWPCLEAIRDRTFRRERDHP